MSALSLAPRALYEEVAELLRQRIFSRELEPGSWIDELKIAEEYGISRTPLREALKVLAAEGLVTMKVRRGAYVTEVSDKDLADVYHLLALLESDAAGVVAGRASEAELAELKALHTELKAAVKKFVTQLRPTLDIAEKNGVRLSIENHAKNLIESPDSLKWLAEFAPSPSLAIAFAPYHLEQDTTMLSELIESLGPGIALFYAWQHGQGCMTKLPNEQELQQLPGRGSLDFKPLLTALKKTGFNGWTEIFMHPVPRGIPIRETESLVTAEINQARQYLEGLIADL